MIPRWIVAVVVLVGCGGMGAPAAPKETRAPVEAKAPQPACVAPREEAAAIAHATSTASRVMYCIGSGNDCFALDVRTGAFERLAEPPKVGAPPLARVETTNPELKVCTSGACTSLTPKVLPGSTTISGATNPDGTFAVFLLGDAPEGKGYAEVWDVPKAKRVATFRYARGDFRCGEVAMLDNVVYVSATQCGTPAARAGLYTLKGQKIANVGGKDFGTYGGAFAQVEGSQWAFLEENANQLVVQDLAKGKVIKTIDTSSLFKSAGAEMGNPGESALVRLANGKLAVIAGAPATGNVATIDVATGELQVIPAPGCK